jgi:hypothetical protein
MTYTTDTENSFPYVLLCSLFGTLVSLAASGSAPPSYTHPQSSPKVSETA